MLKSILRMKGFLFILETSINESNKPLFPLFVPVNDCYLIQKLHH